MFSLMGVLYFFCMAEAITPPKPPDEHPRLLLRSSDIPEIKTRYDSSEMSDLREKLLEQANATSDGHLPDGKPENVWSDVKRRAFEAKAFLYVIQGDVDSGKQAVEMALAYLGSAETTYKEDGLFVSRGMNRAILGASIVYDWCYPLFTPEQRLELIKQIVRVAGNTEYGWPVENGRFVTGHYGEEKNPYMLAAGIAAYDEDPSIYNAMIDHLYNGFVPTRNFFYPGHRHHQGSAYGVDRFGHEAVASLLITRMGFPNPCIADQGKVPYFYMYNRRPDGLFMVEGDDYARGSGPDWFSPAELLHIAANMYQDPYVQDEAWRYGTRVGDAALRILIQDETLARKPVSSLPLTKYFGSPFGAMIARTGWDIQGGKNAGAAVVRMHVKEYMFANHDHLDAGHFSLYYKGALAMDSGIYQGTIGQYGSDHFRNYYQRSVAHNTLLILDPDEPKPLLWRRECESRDGGQFWPDGNRSEFDSVEHLLSCGRRADILAHEFGPDPITPDYSYLKGDMAESYKAPDPYPAKVSEVKRSFVFLNLKNSDHPAALVVYDRVTARDASFKKSWLLHSISEPAISDNITIITRTEDGYNGKLVNHTLLPETHNIVKIGGPGREFWADGKNYPNLPRKGGSYEPGAWRIELSPRNPATTDHFLNVMQVMDAVGGPEPLTISRIETDHFVGIKIADRVVLFSKSGERIHGSLSFTAPDSQGELKYLVTDLKAGKWQVTGPSEHSLEATDDGGAIYFQGAGGTYTLKSE
ncbi:heparin/heparin-sulfate lyase HepB [Candidatus Poribacteria bacterium]